MENTNAPGVSLDMIPYDLAYRAHTGTSFSPEKRAVSAQNGFVQDMNQCYAELSKAAKTTEKKQTLDALWPEFLRRRHKEYMLWLGRMSNVLSPMITGPSNFPVNRNRKSNESEHRASVSYTEGIDKGMAYIRKHMHPELADIRIGDEGSLMKLRKKLETLERNQELMKEINAIIRKTVQSASDDGVVYKKGWTEALVVDAMMGAGAKEKLAIESLKYARGYGIGIPRFSLTNNNANIRRVREQIEMQERHEAAAALAQAAERKTEFEFEGGRVELNFEENRIQVFHDSKPNREAIEALKKTGWRWSPRFGAWQRQLTNNAIGTARQMFGVHDIQYI